MEYKEFKKALETADAYNHYQATIDANNDTAVLVQMSDGTFDQDDPLSVISNSKAGKFTLNPSDSVSGPWMIKNEVLKLIVEYASTPIADRKFTGNNQVSGDDVRLTLPSHYHTCITGPANSLVGRLWKDMETIHEKRPNWFKE